MIRKRILQLLLLIGLLIPAHAVFADEVIKAGETISADLNINDDLQIEAGGTLDANAHLYSGDAVVAGTITGNLLILDGDVELADTAVIEGDCVILGGKVTTNASSTVCTTAGEFDINVPNLAVANAPDSWNLDTDLALELDGGNSIMGAIFGSLFFGLFAFAMAHVAPRQIDMMTDTITAKPVTSGTVGILTFFASISGATLLALLSTALLIVCIGALGFPIVLAILALVVLGIGLGWVAVGNIIGEIMADRLKLHKLSMPRTAAMGTAALSFGIGLIGLLPIVSFSAPVVWWAVGSIGLGAAALTRLGTKSYPAFAPRAGKIDQVIETLDIQ